MTTRKAKLREEVKAAIAEMHEKQGEIPLIRPDVDEAMVAIVVSAWTGVPAGKMVADDIAAPREDGGVLTERIKGQDYGIGVIAKELRSARAGLKAPEQPLGVSSWWARPASARPRPRSASRISCSVASA